MTEVEERFWSRVDSSAGPDECWPWTKARQPNGYGRLKHADKIRFAHRVAFTLAGGEIPEGYYVMHACDNPPCCNPAHLSAGTPADNQRDMRAKGRRGSGDFEKGHTGLRGELCPTSKLTTEQVREIRRRGVIYGEGRRLAQEFGVSFQQVSKIVRGDRWAEVA